MQGDTIIFFGKYTTFSGAVAGTYKYYSDPYDLTLFNQLDVEVFVAALTGSTPNLDVQLEASSDLETWTAIGAPTSITTQGAVQINTSNTLRYVRLVIDNWGNADNVATLWAKGVARNT